MEKSTVRRAVFQDRASKLGQRFLCPGSKELESGIRDEEPETEWAARGTAMHRYAATGDPGDLDDEEKDLVDGYLEHCRGVMMRHEGAAGGNPESLYKNEKELSMELVDDQGEVIVTGTADWVWQANDICEVFDFKSGWAAQNEAAACFQVSAYTAMACQKFGKSEGVGHVWHARSETSYSMQVFDVPRAIFFIREVLQKCVDHGAVRNPSPGACQYCRAFRICPEIEHLMHDVSRYSETLPLPIAAEKLANLMNAAKLAGDRAEMVRREAARLCKNDKALRDKMAEAGWKFVNVKGRRYFPSAMSAYRYMIEKGIAPAEVIQSKFELSYGKAREAFLAGAGALYPTKKEASAAFDELVKEVATRHNESFHLRKGSAKIQRSK